MEEFNNKYVHLRYKILKTQQQKNTTFLDDENICPVCTFSPILIAQNTNVFTFTQIVYFHFFQSMLSHTQQLIVKVTKENYICKHKSVLKASLNFYLAKIKFSSVNYTCIYYTLLNPHKRQI